MASSKTISEHIVELRYKPNAKLLDYRGELAESLSEHMALPEWNINTNRIDVFSTDQTVRAFASFRNAGMFIRNPTEHDYFPNQANKFFRFLLTRKPFSDPLYVERLGVRSRFATPTSKSFKELVNQYTKRVINITPEAQSAFDAELTDIGIPLNFITQYGRINTASGPMGRDQLKQFFEGEKAEDLPEVAFFFELDYWIQPAKEVPQKDILGLVKRYAQENWDRNSKIHLLVLGG